ncbi:MAG TPA: tetratricopeptide repeat protein [Steroidobacteraceae bacterium]|nr:tetratricopeptide repeat protein [Steroidobacteraceae bacterium]
MKGSGPRRKRIAPDAAQGAALQHFGTADVTRIVGLSTAALRSLVRQRHVAPQRGPRGALRFTFQDLIALRTAHALAGAGLPTRRISRALHALRQHLPAQLPLSGLSIRAGGEHVIVREGGAEWEGGSGQYLLALEVTLDTRGLHLSEPAITRSGRSAGSAGDRGSADAAAIRARIPPGAGDSGEEAERCFGEALDSEERDAPSAMQLYRRCLQADPQHVAARINLARLLHASGELSAAEKLYRHVSCRGDALAQFNLAVLLEDQGRREEAIERYLAAVTLDASLADAHYNLARLYDLQGNAPHTIRHLRAFQRLADTHPPDASA